MAKGWKNKPLRRTFGLAAILVVLIIFAGILMLRISPKTGAYGADFLRKIIGNQPVAMLETALFHLEDSLNQAEYGLGLIKPGNPFGNAELPNSGSTPLGNPSTLEPSKPGSSTQAANGLETKQPALPNPDNNNSLIPNQKVGGVSPDWIPGPVDPLGKQPNAGVWQPYLSDSSGRVIAYRSFLQPDPTRPYAYAAIVAFDLKRIHLNYVIGFDDPYAPGVKRTSKGVIANSDLQSGLLLAAFNGGFKYEHGHYGSMANGLVSAPAQDGLGTLAIYQDGQVKIGEWGTDLVSSDSQLAYRQNGPLVIKNGQINPKVDDSLIWGLTITGGTATLRSGLAISPDGRTLYYFAGPSLTVRTLAKAMEAVHPQSGIQLDINNFWVLFVAIHDRNGKLATEPLLAKGMAEDKDRFLRAYPRDFFYITLVPSE